MLIVAFGLSVCNACRNVSILLEVPRCLSTRTTTTRSTLSLRLPICVHLPSTSRIRQDFRLRVIDEPNRSLAKSARLTLFVAHTQSTLATLSQLLPLRTPLSRESLYFKL